MELDELANELLREEGTLVPASPTVKTDGKADAKPLKVGCALRMQRNGYTMFSTCNGICAAHDANAEMRRDWR